eukprot:GFYU01001174.1.p1 GENE.GFYU01001174.1~~GFYU01001174.1.p1  ORF type:complete len:468 (+),score=118.05 GFYU01001174.1:183-1586(+)
MSTYRRKRAPSTTLPDNVVHPVIPSHTDDTDGGVTDPTDTDTDVGRPAVALGPDGQPLLVDQADKWKGWNRRTKWTFIMMGGFFSIVYIGHTALFLLVLSIQVVMYKEMNALFGFWEKDKKILRGSFKYLNWVWFFTACFFTYGRTMRKHMLAHREIRNNMAFLFRHHLMISFMLYIVGFVGFVASLRKRSYKFQFAQFAWCHMVLLYVVIQSSFIVVNIFEGLIWFMLPASLIVSNDVMAYVFGFFFGRTPLIRLSPKKTWEGFIGAFCFTVVWSFFWTRLLLEFEFFICPKKDLSLEWVTCERQEIFLLVQHHIPAVVSEALAAVGIEFTEMWIAPVQWHAMVMAVFASIIGPFGGFFASGLKRAFKIKDFGDSIPGHGGLTDRMDCQVMMGLFAYVYIRSFARRVEYDVASILAYIAKLSSTEQVELYHSFQELLANQGLLTADTMTRKVVQDATNLAAEAIVQ